MAASKFNPVAAAIRQSRSGPCRPLQVANGRPSDTLAAPASDTPAQAVRASWAAWLPGQDVPLIWEQVTDDEPCDR
jgi:hypothetical protein